MGYSIYVKTEDKETRDKLYNFVEKNIKNINKELFGFEEQYQRFSTDLSYTDGSEFVIGFDYNGSGEEKTYITAITKWMAKTLGYNFYMWDYDEIDWLDFTVRDRLNRSIKYYKASKQKVSKKQKYRWAVVESVGMMCLTDNRVDEVVDWIDNEIKILENLWNEN